MRPAPKTLTGANKARIPAATVRTGPNAKLPLTAWEENHCDRNDEEKSHRHKFGKKKTINSSLVNRMIIPTKMTKQQ